MRRVLLIASLGATVALVGAPSASAVPVTIQGTGSSDEIVISASSPLSGTYYVNDTATTFAGATTLTVNAGGGNDTVRVMNPPAGVFAPVLGMRVSGGAGVDSISDTGGQAAYGWLDHDPADGPGTRTIIHGGIHIQKIVLDGVEGSVFDAVTEPNWAYRGKPGTDDIGLREVAIAPGGCCGDQVLTNGDEVVDPAGKGTVTIDTKTSGGAPDSVTLSGDWSLDDDLVVDDGLAPAEDTVRIDSYGRRAQENGLPVSAKVRAAVLNGDGVFFGAALAVDANRMEVGPGRLSTRVDRLEVRSGTDVSVRDADDVQVGGVWESISGVKSGGAVSVETPGKLTVLPGEDVGGTDVTIAANGVDLLGGAQASAGTARLRPEAGGVPLDLGAVDDRPGTLGVSDAELDRFGASRVEVGRADSGQVTVSGPFDRPSTELALVSGGGYMPGAAGSLGADRLELADGSSASRAWTVDGAQVSAGGGPIPYRAGTRLSLKAGAGVDAFAVKASPTAALSIDGGDPAAAPGDTLTYDAEGRTTSGDTDAPDGSIESPGVKVVGFTRMESVAVLDGTSPVPSTPGTPLEIRGTPGQDRIEIVQLAPNSGEYRVNGRSFPFAAPSKIVVDGRGHYDTIEIVNQTGMLLAPPEGIRVNGGADYDALEVRGGTSVSGSFEEEGGGSGAALVTHTGGGAQRIVLDNVRRVTDSVGEESWAYRGLAGPDNISLVNIGPQGTARCCGRGAIQGTRTYVDPTGKTSVTLDTRTAGAGTDVVTLTGRWPIASRLTVDDGSAVPEDLVLSDFYSPSGFRPVSGGPPHEDLSIRADTLKSIYPYSPGSIGFDSTTFALEARRLEDTDGNPGATLHVALPDIVEVHTQDDLTFTSNGRPQFGGLPEPIGGMRSDGDVHLTTYGTSGAIIVAAGEQVSGDSVRLQSGDLQLDGTVSAPGGAVHLTTATPDWQGPQTVDLGGAGPANSQSISDAELDRIDAASIEVGAPHTGLFTVSAPITAPGSTPLRLVSGAGFAGTAGAALDASDIEIADGASSGRGWTVGPMGFEVDGAGPIAFSTAGTLSLAGGAGDDTFAVRASPLVPYSLDGGAGSDSLTYDAEGRTTSGDSTPPDGSIESPGVQPVAFGAIEAVTIAP